MARTIPTIYQSILDSIAAKPELVLLNSPSAVAIYKLLASAVAAALWVHETIFDRHRADVETALARAQPGTAKWYADQVKKFQAGDTLLVDDDGIHYPAGSTGDKIVSQATAKENVSTGKLYIKVATADTLSVGGLKPLTVAEKNQVIGYVNAIRYPGTRIEVVTLNPDYLRVIGEVYYDPLQDLNTLKTRVRAAVQDYLLALEFDGQVFKARIEDAIQRVPGVKDLLITSVQARAHGSTALTDIRRVYETEAGYIVEDPLALFVDTISFVPYG
ncbi:hypothetical protein [Hymenobacter sp. CRA2]|uniref:hypothetical protein n=1 Tax=Hymenobacter sp. CRA2 TaxID=1955620 RepID=UPI00098F0884|nr:hypothetical protein [Hymenobacter sp. CRA2]OON67803.1 hypothetical protein B0919_16595 [Hymenobacter sp. CRA2]